MAISGGPLYESQCYQLRDLQRVVAAATGPLAPAALAAVEANFKRCLASAIPGEPPQDELTPTVHPCRHIGILLGLDADNLPGGWSGLPIEVRRGLAQACRDECSPIPYENYGDRGAIGCSNDVLDAVAKVLDGSGARGAGGRRPIGLDAVPRGQGRGQGFVGQGQTSGQTSGQETPGDVETPSDVSEVGSEAAEPSRGILVAVGVVLVGLVILVLR